MSRTHKWLSSLYWTVLWNHPFSVSGVVYTLFAECQSYTPTRFTVIWLINVMTSPLAFTNILSEIALLMPGLAALYCTTPSEPPFREWKCSVQEVNCFKLTHRSHLFLQNFDSDYGNVPIGITFSWKFVYRTKEVNYFIGTTFSNEICHLFKGF